jgi:hypothetical protein
MPQRNVRFEYWVIVVFWRRRGAGKLFKNSAALSIFGIIEVKYKKWYLNLD